MGTSSLRDLNPGIVGKLLIKNAFGYLTNAILFRIFASRNTYSCFLHADYIFYSEII